MDGYCCPECKCPLDDNNKCYKCDGTGYDLVNKPAHYNIGDGVECIDYIKQVLGTQGFIDYCHGNMIKYQHRYKYKRNPVEDMKKAQWYLRRMVETLEEVHK